MANIDFDKILNSSPKKRLIIGYENLKRNFTEDAAMEYSECYKDKSLSFILENSRYIFAEPYHGLKFYENTIENMGKYCAFTEFENELEKVMDYIDDHPTMPKEQRMMYENLCDTIKTNMRYYTNSSLIVNYALEHGMIDKDTLTSISDVLYLHETKNYDSDEEIMNNLYESIDDTYTFYSLTPYISAVYENPLYTSSKIGEYYNESSNEDDTSTWRNFIESSVILSKLCNDHGYKLALGKVRNRDVKVIFESLAEEALGSHINSIVEEKCTSKDVYYASPNSSVNNIFENESLYELMRDDNEKLREHREELLEATYSIISDLVFFEYMNCDDSTSMISGYNNFFEQGTSISDAFDMFIEMDAVLKDNPVNSGEPSRVVAKHTSKYGEYTEDDDKKSKSKKTDKDDDLDIDDEDDEETSDVTSTDKTDSKKSDDELINSDKGAIKSKSKIDDFTHKNMDKEAKYYKKKGERAVKNAKIKNAAKSAVAIPKSVITDTKAKVDDTIRKWDEMDDNRRREYIIKPGFRKKWIKNLKLALMYGGAAKAKLTLVPLLMVARHFSKKKDLRIRQDLKRELETEIAIVDAKINDAEANGDREQKYKLMRVKSQLEKEQLRVASNSKYV